MPQSLLDEDYAWSSGSKIELVDGQLIVGDSLTHSRLLLSQILRGWGIEAVVALAGQQLWWKALSQAFGTLEFANLSELDVASVQQWAEQIDFEPELPLHHGDWRWTYSQLRQSLRLAMFNLGSRHEKLGQSLGNGFVNRIGEQGCPIFCSIADTPATVCTNTIWMGLLMSLWNLFNPCAIATLVMSSGRSIKLQVCQSIGLSTRPKNRLNCFA